MCVKSLKNWGQFPGNLVLATEFTHNLLLHGSQNMSSRYLFDKCKTQNSHSATIGNGFHLVSASKRLRN